MGTNRSSAKEGRLLVGIGGIPASGKSTFARLLLDKIHEQGHSDAILVGLDGWHLTRSQLSAMPDPVLAHARRGAHWTFDAEAYLAFVKQLRRNEDVDSIPFPIFSHSVKDPTPSPIPVLPTHSIVLIEGLYVLLGLPGSPWLEAGELLDEKWLLSVDKEVAKRRLSLRHVESGITPTEQEGLTRAVENDLPSMSGPLIFPHYPQCTHRWPIHARTRC